MNYRYTIEMVYQRANGRTAWAVVESCLDNPLRIVFSAPTSREAAEYYLRYFSI